MQPGLGFDMVKGSKDRIHLPEMLVRDAISSRYQGSSGPSSTPCFLSSLHIRFVVLPSDSQYCHQSFLPFIHQVTCAINPAYILPALPSATHVACRATSSICRSPKANGVWEGGGGERGQARTQLYFSCHEIIRLPVSRMSGCQLPKSAASHNRYHARKQDERLPLPE